MLKKLFIVFVVVIMAAGILLTGSSWAEPVDMKPVSGGTLRIIVGLEPNSLGYPPKTGGRASFFIHPCIESLLTYNDKMEITGMLAESWVVDHNAKTVTFKIRKGVKFHDGTDMDAEAAAWNIQLMKDTKSYFEYLNIESIDVLDKYTMRFNLKQISNTMFHGMSYKSAMISPTAFKKNGGADWAIGHPVGTGPYQFKEFQRGAKLAYTRFDDYWGGKPYLDGIEFRIVKDPTVSMATMKAGEADMWIIADMKEAINLEKEGFTARYCQGAVNGMWPSGREEGSIFKDKRIRLALDYAVDREAITNAISYGSPAVLPAYQRPFPGDPGYREGYGRKYNPKKAKELLKEAGYPNGFSTTFYVSQTSAMDKTVATSVQAYLAAVGIKSKIEFVAPSAFFGMRLHGWKNGLYFAGDPRSEWPPQELASHLPIKPDGILSWNYSIYVPDDMKAMLRDMMAAPTNEAQLEKYIKLVHYVDDECIYLNHTYWPDVAVIAPYVHTSWIAFSTKIWPSYKDWMEKH